MFDTSSSVGIVFTPKTDKFVQMMRAQNGPIAREIIKIIHNNGHKQIDNLASEIKTWIFTQNQPKGVKLPKRNTKRRKRWSKGWQTRYRSGLWSCYESRPTADHKLGPLFDQSITTENIYIPF